MRFDIVPIKHTYQLYDVNGNACDTTTNTTGYETKVMNQDQVKQMYEIHGEDVEGYFAYANKALYNISNEYHEGSVNASYSSLGDGVLQTFLSFEHFDTELIYDPSVGVDEDTLDAAGSIELVFVSVGALMAIGLVLYRKRK
jgi:hypothetical protein